MTQRLERQLCDTPYPFEHSKVALSIGIFVGHGLPMVDGYEIEVHARTSAVLERLMTLYRRALDRLAVVAEQLENAAQSAVGRSLSPSDLGREAKSSRTPDGGMDAGSSSGG